jgi:hypothetical protein
MSISNFKCSYCGKMKTKHFIVLYIAFILLLLSGPPTFALLDHYEYNPPEHRYELERRVFEANRDPSDWSCDFPSFDVWQANENRREESFVQYLNEGIVACFASQEEYERYCAEYSVQQYSDGWQKNQLDTDRDAPSYSDCPQAQERKGPND